MLRQALCLCVLVMVGMLGQASNALADKRVALLIGNSAYQTLAPSKTPANNVAAMKAAFQKAGFDKVDTSLDLSHDEFIKTLRKFEDDVQDADIAVVYYSGHGMEMNGQNFLVPVDAKLQSDRDVEDEAVSLDRIMRSVDSARRLKLVVLDASRLNPFHQRRTDRCLLARCLSARPAFDENESSDVLVLYAAKAGTAVAEDDQPVSPFTKALVSHLFQPGRDIRLAAQDVRDDVLAATHRQQEPFAYGSLGGGEISLAR